MCPAKRRRLKKARPGGAAAGTEAAAARADERETLTDLLDDWRADVDRAIRIMQCESKGEPDARNGRSGASGLFQHMPRYWDERADAIAQTYLWVLKQPRSAWTWEVELRPWVETF